MENRNNTIRIDRVNAEKLLSSFIPMFEWLDEHEVDYCLVGGLGVLVHALNVGMEELRVTFDSDIMFDASFTNKDFARAYLDVYASDPRYSKIVYEAVFGEGAFEALETEVQALVNASFIGADIELDGISTPNFDIVRNLNEMNLNEIDREEVEILGCHIKVATVPQLLNMKERTIEMLHADFESTSRPQDFIDAARLRSIIDKVRDDQI